MGNTRIGPYGDTWEGLKCTGIDVVAALDYIRRHPSIADHPFFIPIWPYVDVMQSHMNKEVG